MRKTLHPTLGRSLGFRPEFVRAQACARVDDLADLILQSSCTPPFTPVLRRGGRPVLDGGMVDNVPVDALDPTPGDVLVLVTRLYPRPQMFTVAHGEQRRLYVQPSSKVPISSWDYTAVADAACVRPRAARRRAFPHARRRDDGRPRGRLKTEAGSGAARQARPAALSARGAASVLPG